MIFESHAHYDDERFDEDRDQLLTSMKDHGIGIIINVGASMEGCQKSLKMAETYEFVYAALGVHPSDISDLDQEGTGWIEDHLSHSKVAAVGEIGLDYYWGKEPEVHNRQKYWFCRQLDIAKQADLPVIIHSREAAADTMDILSQSCYRDLRGVVHCYSYSREMAAQYVKMGYYIGVGGVVTFKASRKLKETVEDIPLEKILLETDSPYLAPQPYRGKRNSSLYLPYVVEEIARIKDVSEEEVIRVTNENARTLFSKVK